MNGPALVIRGQISKMGEKKKKGEKMHTELEPQAGMKQGTFLLGTKDICPKFINFKVDFWLF